MKFVSAQSRPEEKLRAAGCQQGTPVVATAVALFYGVCKGSSLIILQAPHISNQPSFVTPCAFLCDIQGVGPCHFIDHGFCQSRHALKQSMWPVWLRTSFETNWEFTQAHAKRSQRHLRSKTGQRKNLEQQGASREHLQWPQQWPCFMVYPGGPA